MGSINLHFEKLYFFFNLTLLKLMNSVGSRFESILTALTL